MRYNSKLDDGLFDHKQSKQLTSLCSTTLDPPSWCSCTLFLL